MQRNGRWVESIHIALQLEDIHHTFLSGLLHHIESELKQIDELLYE